jgi:hypothetical protein
MKAATTGTLSGCVIWIIVFGMICMCIFPISVAIGGFSSVSNFAIRQTGAIICPDNTAPEVYSYASTTTAEFGNRQPFTAFELHCVNINGKVVKEDPVLYAFLWIGTIAVTGLIIAALLSFALAAPAGVLIAKLLNRRKNRRLQ